MLNPCVFGVDTSSNSLSRLWFVCVYSINYGFKQFFITNLATIYRSLTQVFTQPRVTSLTVVSEGFNHSFHTPYHHNRFYINIIRRAI